MTADDDESAFHLTVINLKDELEARMLPVMLSNIVATDLKDIVLNQIYFGYLTIY